MNKPYRHSFWWCMLFLLLIAISGACDRRADVSPSNTEVHIVRFEEALFSADPATIKDKIPVWKQDFGKFFRHFCTIMQLGNIDDPAFPERLSAFVTNRSNYLIYQRTKQVFPDLNKLTEDLSAAFGYYRHYFPGKPVPKVYTYISGFNRSAITDDSLLAIGLDKYLGSDEILYKEVGIFNYLTVNMHPAKIPSDCMVFWGETEFPFHDSINNLITNMIYRGRMLYFASALLPGQPDSLTWGFTSHELDYFNESERGMWAYLVDQRLLFNTDRFTIGKFILEGPFTKDFGRGSPARASVWIGYRIVRSYLSRHPEVSLQALMEETDYLKILNESAYNP